MNKLETEVFFLHIYIKYQTKKHRKLKIFQLRIEKNVVTPPPINIWSQLNLFFKLGFFQTPPPLFEQMSENLQFFFWTASLTLD